MTSSSPYLSLPLLCSLLALALLAAPFYFRSLRFIHLDNAKKAFLCKQKSPLVSREPWLCFPFRPGLLSGKPLTSSGIRVQLQLQPLYLTAWWREPKGHVCTVAGS